MARDYEAGTSFDPPDPPAKSPPAPIDCETFERIVEQWFIEAFYGSVVSRDTPTFNHVRRSVDELKRRLFPG